MNQKTDVGAAVRVFLARSGVSHTRLAKSLGISQSSLSARLKGIDGPSGTLRFARDISEALGYEFSELVKEAELITKTRKKGKEIKNAR